MNSYPVCVSREKAWTVISKDELVDAYTAQAYKNGLTLWCKSTIGELIEDGCVDPEKYSGIDPDTPVWKSDFCGGGEWVFSELSVWQATKEAARSEGITIYDSHVDALMNEERESFRNYIISKEGLLNLFMEVYMSPSLDPVQVSERLHAFILQEEDG